MAAAKGIFDGVRIIELAQYVFVPGASVLMADQGAEVIKIETVGAGDPYRSLKIGDGREVGSTNLAMEQNNRGKKSIALDLKTPEGRDALVALIRTADVFLTSIRGKALKSLKLDVEDVQAINPTIVYARGNGLGYRGAEADKAGFDASCFWARGGMAYLMTPPGQKTPSARPALGDHSASMALAFGIAGALFKRAVSGEGSVVDTSLLATAVWMLSADFTYSQSPSYVAHAAGGARFPLMSTYPTKDGRLVQLMLLNPQPHWPGLCKMLGIETLIDDPRFVDNPARMAHCDELMAIIGERIGSRDWSEWKPLFDAWDAPWELFQTVQDVTSDPQVLANEMIFDLDVRDGAPIRVVAGPASFNGAAAPIAARHSPDLGEHTDDLLMEVGYSAQQIADLKAAGAVQ